MLKKLQVLAVLTCMLSYLSSAVAGTVSIGTVSARGDMRVDSYMVNGNATLFDGSVVETGQASANLRLSKGTEITMGRSSRGTLHRDRLVLLQGESELAASSAFQVEVNGLRVTPSETNSRGAVSMQSGNTMEVAALTGSFVVTNNQGVLLATVRPGHSLSFAIQAGGESSTVGSTFSGTGPVSTDGTNYFITINEVKYQITGKNLASLVGKNVKVTGTISGTTVSGVAPAVGASAVVAVTTTQIIAAGVFGSTASVIAGVAVVGGLGAGIATGFYESNKKPASP